MIKILKERSQVPFANQCTSLKRLKTTAVGKLNSCKA